ncbi:50S ribosomal protein L15 [Gimesia fumaroli]|jgi:large subunit ribosomal protein L15|uniref:Large ribosomal subunit protein uL15 n=1 Tax=Gimesia fumaroli TaxID=2527976 RepID=A0A518IKF5_9PLAN|nr:50S ribosomal protein L15 [Gimesia fumaroli]QDV53525.1 50S ribosomal protein L15 [Gimesia fumaroli]
MIIDDVHRGIKKNKKRKRVGRGPGSGHGKTSTRGHNGYGSRSGSSRRTSFEGGQTPLALRVAKRGFNNKQFAKKVAVVNVSALEQAFESGTEITPEILAAKGLAKGRFDQVKILGNGDLSKKFSVAAHLFSQSAEEKIQAAGGAVSRIMS